MRSPSPVAAVLLASLAVGCGDDEGSGAASETTRSVPRAGAATTATTGTGTATTGTATTGRTGPDGAGSGATGNGPAGVSPAATAAETAALPTGLVPGDTASTAEDPAAIADLRARLSRAPSRLRRAGTARYALDLTLASTGRLRGDGRADFRSGESLGALRVQGTRIDQYNDGTLSFTRTPPDATWVRDTPIVPNAPGNSTAIYAQQVRVGRAGAERSVAGVRCRWAAGVVPLRGLLEAAGATDAPAARAVLRAAKRDAVYPIGACVSADGLIAEVRLGVRFDRDLGLPGSAGRETFTGRIAFSDFGRAPAITRPAGVPAD